MYRVLPKPLLSLHLLLVTLVLVSRYASILSRTLPHLEPGSGFGTGAVSVSTPTGHSSLEVGGAVCLSAQPNQAPIGMPVDEEVMTGAICDKLVVLADHWLVNPLSVQKPEVCLILWHLVQLVSQYPLLTHSMMDEACVAAIVASSSDSVDATRRGGEFLQWITSSAISFGRNWNVPFPKPTLHVSGFKRRLAAIAAARKAARDMSLSSDGMSYPIDQMDTVSEVPSEKSSLSRMSLSEKQTYGINKMMIKEFDSEVKPFNAGETDWKHFKTSVSKVLFAQVNGRPLFADMEQELMLRKKCGPDAKGFLETTQENNPGASVERQLQWLDERYSGVDLGQHEIEVLQELRQYEHESFQEVYHRIRGQAKFIEKKYGSTEEHLQRLENIQCQTLLFGFHPSQKHIALRLRRSINSCPGKVSFEAHYRFVERLTQDLPTPTAGTLEGRSPVHSSSRDARTPRVCGSFLSSGTCRFGSQCKWKHVRRSAEVCPLSVTNTCPHGADGRWCLKTHRVQQLDGTAQHSSGRSTERVNLVSLELVPGVEGVSSLVRPVQSDPGARVAVPEVQWQISFLTEDGRSSALDRSYLALVDSCSSICLMSSSLAQRLLEVGAAVEIPTVPAVLEFADQRQLQASTELLVRVAGYETLSLRDAGVENPRQVTTALPAVVLRFIVIPRVSGGILLGRDAIAMFGRQPLFQLPSPEVVTGVQEEYLSRYQSLLRNPQHGPRLPTAKYQVRAAHTADLPKSIQAVLADAGNSLSKIRTQVAARHTELPSFVDNQVGLAARSRLTSLEQTVVQQLFGSQEALHPDDIDYLESFWADSLPNTLSIFKAPVAQQVIWDPMLRIRRQCRCEVILPLKEWEWRSSSLEHRICPATHFPWRSQQ